MRHVVQGFSGTASSGPLVLAIPVAITAGLLSFFSPCVLPLLPAYFSYTTGISGSEIAAGNPPRRRMTAGAALFVSGFSSVFVAVGLALGTFSVWLAAYHRQIEVCLGALTVVFGLLLLGALPVLHRDLRFHRVPRVGLAAAPLLGGLFAIGWTPCAGPTLGAISNLALVSGGALRGGILLAAYASGLGLPFIFAALVWGRTMTAIGWIRQRAKVMTWAAGSMLVAIGVLLLTGWWDVGTQWVQLQISQRWPSLSA